MEEKKRVSKKEFTKEFRSLLNKDYGLYFGTVDDVDKVVKGFLETITKILSEDKMIQFIGFGVFDVKHREGREGHNPHTGKKMKIAAYELPTFKAGISLKKAVNTKSKKSKIKR